jgi:hypothetical protein
VESEPSPRPPPATAAAAATEAQQQRLRAHARRLEEELLEARLARDRLAAQADALRRDIQVAAGPLRTSCAGKHRVQAIARRTPILRIPGESAGEC